MNNNQREQFKICAEKRLAKYLQQRDKELLEQIERESDDYISNVDEPRYIQYLVDEYSLDTPSLDFDNVEASTGKKLVPAEQFPGGFHVRRGESYLKGTVIYHIPCSGDVDLLEYYPDDFIVDYGPVGYIEDGHLCFEVIDFYDDLERLKPALKQQLNSIRTISSKLIQAVENYNYNLKYQVKQLLGERKRRINNIVQVLGVPIKRRENLPPSYTLPAPRSRKNISLKPQVSGHGGGVEYSLDDSIYYEILQIIHDYGKVFEQYPSTYNGKKEEELRDHFLLVLQPHYNWTATGEAFNKVGKTDILIRYEKTTVFIAECKFWHGKKGYIDTISQLLGYLTWRNSKAAVVVFVRNKDFSSVIDSVKEATATHPNFIKFVNEKDETWLNYIFHINDNPSREVKLAVLLFSIPSVGEAEGLEAAT